MRHALSILAVVATLGLASGASAVVWVFDFTLDGGQEVPPNGSPGTGAATVTLDDVTGDLVLTGTYQDLLTDRIAQHIHGPAPPGSNAGIILPLSGTGTTSGTIFGNGTLTAPQVQDMIDGLTYVNVHSAGIPGGEIRGQVVPEPATFLALGAGLALIGRRRRR